MSLHHLTFLIILLFITLNLSANSPEAKELFNKAECMSCHESIDFSHKKDKVNSFKKLHTSVEACVINNEVEWFDDETLDVTEYLNKKYYFFKSKE
ncbi:hypothetical protein GJV85_08155 [Sulfurimonas aquatica]|uniref:Cytochrome c n=1 Tax=Sulfurimonas aquatica TaxID=2672570 RepID=A0A975GD97_9BACT|nr:hypothetical protein [Sulfurimonas aquatica]QSZ42084.1 hypothetical protein GJV85_08155 [Sulfurimonas aquatica]